MTTGYVPSGNFKKNVSAAFREAVERRRELETLMKVCRKVIEAKKMSTFLRSDYDLRMAIRDLEDAVIRLEGRGFRVADFHNGIMQPIENEKEKIC